MIDWTTSIRRRNAVNTSFLAMGIAILMTLGLLLGVAVLSLLSGAFSFLFARPRIQILKSLKGDDGFAFSFSSGGTAESNNFDQVRVRLYNPFGTPDQVDISAKFPTTRDYFAQDVDFGPGYRRLLDAKNTDKATVQIELSSKRENLTLDKLMPFKKFQQERSRAKLTVEQFKKQTGPSSPTKKYYHIPKKDFIAPPIPQKNKTLKLATNPEFATDFAGAAADGAASNKENYPVSKVWIDPGCIVCNACEAIYPEVFEVTEDTCLIRPNAPLNDGLKIEEAAEACPVEVIKFVKA